MTLTFESDEGRSVPRQIEVEATDSIRGYAWQFLHVIDRLLSSGPEALIYVEAFEDILEVGQSVLKAEQGKDKGGDFSITQQTSCDILERWASLADAESHATFVYFSTQGAGSTHDHSDCFKRYTSGETSAATIEEIRLSLSSFLAKKPPDKFPLLLGLSADPKAFSEFWGKINWRLSEAKLPELLESNITKARALYNNEGAEVTRKRVFTWLGAIICSAASPDLSERRWTFSKLQELDPETSSDKLTSLVSLITALASRRNEDLVTRLEELVRQNTQPKGWALDPPAFAQSPRLNAASEFARKLLANGASIVALTGRPGDGKTQVACQIARDEKGAYIALPAADAPENAWNAALRTACSAFGHNDIAEECTLPELLARYRAAAAKAGVRLVVFDNVDSRPPFALSDLVSGAASFACVLVGPGGGGVSAHAPLQAPSDDEFISISTSGLPAHFIVPAAARDTILRIAKITSHSALVAECLSYSAPDFLEEDLMGYEKAIASSPNLDCEDRIQAAFAKCWSGLKDIEKCRVTFVAATGEPEIPLEWLPLPLRQGGGREWRMLANSGLATRNATPSTLRIHRLFARGALGAATASEAAPVVAALLGWAKNGAHTGELKMDGPRQRAFERAFTFVRKAAALPAGNNEQPLLLSTFLDCARSARSDHANLEALLSELWPSGPSAAVLPAEVAARLLDVIGTNFEKSSQILRAWREQAWQTVATYVANNPISGAVSADQAASQRADIHRHFAKALAKSDIPSAISKLKELIDYCRKASSHSSSCEWVIQDAKATLQLAKALRQQAKTQGYTSLDDAAKAIVEQLKIRPACSPAYLRLAMMKALLSMKNVSPDAFSDVDRFSILQEGLHLCDQPGNTEVRGEFLKAMLRDVEIEGAYQLYPDIRKAIAPIVADYVAQGAALSLNRFSAGHVVIKAAGMGEAAEDHEAICDIIRLYTSVAERLDGFHLGRIAAAYREIRLFEQAAELAKCAKEKDNNFDNAYELAKISRWKADFPAARGILNELLDEGERLEAVRDELAKLVSAEGGGAEVDQLLSENIESYTASGMSFFAQRCRDWRTQRHEEALSGTGLRQDEWRSIKRVEALPPERSTKLTDEMLDCFGRIMKALGKS